MYVHVGSHQDGRLQTLPFGLIINYSPTESEVFCIKSLAGDLARGDLSSEPTLQTCM